MTPPFEVMAYNSVSSSTINAPTRVPRRRSYWIVRMPLPPRPCPVYSSIGGRLASPPARGGPPPRPQRLVGRREPDGLAFRRHQQQIVVRGAQHRTDQLVAVAQV